MRVDAISVRRCRRPREQLRQREDADGDHRKSNFDSERRADGHDCPEHDDDGQRLEKVHRQQKSLVDVHAAHLRHEVIDQVADRADVAERSEHDDKVESPTHLQETPFAWRDRVPAAVAEEEQRHDRDGNEACLEREFREGPGWLEAG